MFEDATFESTGSIRTGSPSWMIAALAVNSSIVLMLVLVPLIGLAPVITNAVNLLLVGFMLALSAAALPAQLCNDWTSMLAARPSRVPCETR